MALATVQCRRGADISRLWISGVAARLKIDTTEANLQKYFPDGPRTFPSKGRITLGSYAELNEAIAADFGMDEGERIYVKCYRNGRCASLWALRTR